MLEVLVRIFSSLLMIVAGYYVIKNITKEKSKKLTSPDILLFFILILFTIINYTTNYTVIYTISITLLNILVYKIVFKLNLTQAITSVTIFMILLFISDFAVTVVLRTFISMKEIRSNEFYFIFANVSVYVLCILLFKSKIIKNQIIVFYQNVVIKEKMINTMFLILLIVDFCVLSYNLTRLEVFKNEYLINFIGVIIFCIIGYSYVTSKNKYNELSNQYDNLFSYVQTFEDWIEKEQLNRHEYKNQLAVIRCITKDKKVKDKIDEILEDNINIDEQSLTNLKNLPKGGLKGLMYYKAALAQKQKIKLSTDVYLSEKNLLSKLSKNEIRTLCRLVGIYFDNAIEAAIESKKKIVVVEIYELKDSVSIVFSNTFKNHNNLKNRNKKGVSSKGHGRGNGLYFASKLLKENKWVEESQEIIDNYYIEQLSIKISQNKKLY